MEHIIITTQDELANHTIVETFGLVRGNTVRSRNVVRNMIANFRTIVGGEVNEYTKMLAQSREQALLRLKEHAHSLGANAVVAVRVDSSEIAQQCSEILAYGTAVRVEKN